MQLSSSGTVIACFGTHIFSHYIPFVVKAAPSLFFSDPLAGLAVDSPLCAVRALALLTFLECNIDAGFVKNFLTAAFLLFANLPLAFFVVATLFGGTTIAAGVYLCADGP